MTGTAPLQGRCVLVIGRGSGIARAVALTTRHAGARIVAAGRNRAALDAAYRDEPDVTTETVDTLAVAITNGAADTLTRSLAVELAPIRVNAISPASSTPGAWDALGAQGGADLFAAQGERNPARRIGTAGDVADAVLFALTNTFLT